jgi:hypothetical protein
MRSCFSRRSGFTSKPDVPSPVSLNMGARVMLSAPEAMA